MTFPGDTAQETLQSVLQILSHHPWSPFPRNTLKLGDGCISGDLEGKFLGHPWIFLQELMDGKVADAGSMVGQAIRDADVDLSLEYEYCDPIPGTMTARATKARGASTFVESVTFEQDPDYDPDEWVDNEELDELLKDHEGFDFVVRIDFPAGTTPGRANEAISTIDEFADTNLLLVRGGGSPRAEGEISSERREPPLRRLEVVLDKVRRRDGALFLLLRESTMLLGQAANPRRLFQKSAGDVLFKDAT